MPILLRSKKEFVNLFGQRFVSKPNDFVLLEAKSLGLSTIFKGGPGSGNWEGPGDPRYAHESTTHETPTRDFPANREMSDDELKSKINDDRLIGSMYNKSPDISKMSVDDRLRYMELNATSSAKHIDYKRIHDSLTPYEFYLKEYVSYVRDKVPKGLTADGIRTFLKKNNLISEMPTVYVAGGGDFLEGDLTKDLFDKQKDEFVEKFPVAFKKVADAGRYPIEISPDKRDFSVSQMERMSDKFAEVSGKQGFAYPEEIYQTKDFPAGEMDIQQNKLGAFSGDKDIALYSMLSGWAKTGGGRFEQKILREVSNQEFPLNKGVQFWNGQEQGREDEPFYSPERMKGHVAVLKKETEDFYKSKFATKKDPIPDLSKKTLDIYRGVGGHSEDGYRPAAVESWTIQKSSANKFGKMMSVRPEGTFWSPGETNAQKYSLLSSKISYNDIVWSYESVKGKYGWPDDKDLKGKKEFVVMGGTLLTSGITQEKLYD